ncbi:MAG: electron transfer flavoprotein subunit beta/FixA family protein [Chlamydiae bacterium]|nr:electron transfer flavoprotein subunit beta/FixA family protein [Chlamydiota bacterium]MBI3278135.1 electron transfer flavoprotein subunit beta/FixA family protein [Chlamydiota bacterium]
MKIIALAKQVPDTKDQTFQQNFHVLREGLDLICNPSDEYAIEEAVRLKERLTGEVVVISMGKPTALNLLRFSVSVGADRGILLSDPSFAGSDLLGTAFILSRAIEKNSPFDLIISGKQSSDGENGIISSAIAECLKLPFVMDVRKVIEIKEGVLRLEQMVIGGYYEIEVQLPALISVVKEINEPRLPSLKGKMAAKNVPIPIWGLKELELEVSLIGDQGAQTQVCAVQDPPKKEGVKIFSGRAEEAAAELVNELLKKKLI